FDDTASPFLRGLEIQLALRHDEQDDDFAADPSDVDSGRLQARFAATTYTIGAKLSPLPWLMLRASYATGEQPPSLGVLEGEQDLTTSYAYANDPKRGGAPLGSEGDYLLRFGGNPGLKALDARTLFLGAVFTPFGPDGVRLAIDFSQVRKSNDVLILLP